MIILPLASARKAIDPFSVSFKTKIIAFSCSSHFFFDDDNKSLSFNCVNAYIHKIFSCTIHINILSQEVQWLQYFFFAIVYLIGEGVPIILA